MVYRGAVTVIGVVVRPRSTFAALAASPRIALGFAAVLGSAIVSLLLGLLANQLDNGGRSGTVASLVLPLLFLVYWGAAALIIDAAAGLARQAGRWRQYLAVSGFTFIPWIAYAILAVIEAAFGAGSAAEYVVAWLDSPASRVVPRPDDARGALGLRREPVCGGIARDAAQRSAAVHPDRGALLGQSLSGSRDV